MANESGFGYQGVLMQDETRENVECAACGIWAKKITTAHLLKCSKLTIEAYKEKYGLYTGAGLVSDMTSLRLTQNALKNRSAMEGFAKNAQSFGIKAAFAGQKKATISMKSMAWNNKLGTCPEQLRQRLKDFILCNRELPGQHNRGYSLYKALKRKFNDSYSEGLKFYGLPYRARKGTNLSFTFPDGSIYAYNLNRPYDREALFNLMLEKCDMFKEKNEVNLKVTPINLTKKTYEPISA